ncbi:MAG: tRNA uridine-5-carboxymethylaminomethyl(34) synthesis GTPase MnmE [Neisseriaceae bacterium]|nr:MAG: tRNA uridine-5-carboxymethylaminomethyl(34) synthesis GTPase MnmE [Neisseriaceae bacterium]
MRYTQDNIVAIASGSGQAGVGVIRISGNNLVELALALTRKQNLKPRFAHYGEFVDANGEIIDSGLIIWFDAPRSFTGEDVLELQGHGSPVVLNMLLKRCLALGCRLAEAGEFTKRAYLNGKLDLVQAESIADLIHAESEATAKGALKSLKGEFSRHIDVINEQLINLRMFVEATLDFPEEDIEFIANAKIQQKLELLREQIYQLLSSTQQGVILNNGANIVIIGRPNVGKSSLLNALANEEVAIVTSIAGTTRDIVRQKIIIDGVPFNIIDTAGIRETQDVVEQIGIERAISAVKEADLALVLIDDSIGMSDEDCQILDKLPAELPRIFVHNKIDLSAGIASITENESGTQVYISAKLNLGINLLRQKLLSLIGWENSASDVFLARTRHLDAMRLTVAHIDNAFSNWQSLEILAEELRYSHTALSSITGEFSADDLLGEIFSKFCIGK